MPDYLAVGSNDDKHVDVRAIAATSRKLEDMVSDNRFREDLYYRLNVVSVEMPPLCERKEDIIALAMFFVRKFGGELKKNTALRLRQMGLTQTQIDALDQKPADSLTSQILSPISGTDIAWRFSSLSIRALSSSLT
jgi:transcriptional regulator with GAF, ATPase, and Fis domain